jgi:hypothetical protein
VGPARPFACVVARCMRSRSRGRWISVFKTAIRRRAVVVEFVCAFCGGVGASRGCKSGPNSAVGLESGEPGICVRARHTALRRRVGPASLFITWQKRRSSIRAVLFA